MHYSVFLFRVFARCISILEALSIISLAGDIDQYDPAYIKGLHGWGCLLDIYYTIYLPVD
jgi:hypothetical protein